MAKCMKDSTLKQEIHNDKQNFLLKGSSKPLLAIPFNSFPVYNYDALNLVSWYPKLSKNQRIMRASRLNICRFASNM